MMLRSVFQIGTLLIALATTGCLESSGSREVDSDLIQYAASLAKSLPNNLDAQGWLNSEPLTSAGDQLSGKVVVIDCWAHWCVPCRQLAPELEASYLKYGEDGQVKFVGITPDSEDKMPEIKAFLNEFDHRWPVAYGARSALKALGIVVFPTILVFDRTGQRVWNSFEPGTLDEAIEKVLASDKN